MSRRLVRQGGRWLALAFALPALAAAPVRAADAAPAKGEVVDGLFVSVRNPIDSKVVKRVMDMTNRFLDRPDHHGLKIVYDFNPEGYASSTADYGTCRDLAEFILRLQDVTTIAFVHQDVTGHTVLPMLACKEIVMSDKARLGDAARGQPGALEEDKRVFYELVAKRRNRYPAVVLKMLDKDMDVMEGKLRNGDLWYIDKREAQREAAHGFVPTAAVPVLPAGNPGLYTADQAEKFGLCERLRVETRQGVKDAYHLPTSALREDPLQGRSPNAWRVVVGGTINKRMQEGLTRHVRRMVARGGNLIILQLECGEGDPQVAREIADLLRTLTDNEGKHPVMTVAYVTKQARNTAAFLALGCTEIVMDQDARLGDFDRVVQGRPGYQEAISKSLEEVAEQQGYSPLVARALLDPRVTLYLVRTQKGKFHERRLLDDDEWQQDQAGDRRFALEEVIKKGGKEEKKSWHLTAATGKKLDVVKHVFTGQQHEFVAWVSDKYGLDQVQDASLDWLDDVAAFLCHPVVSVFLIMIGITGLILELKIPGIGFPGVIAALCFVLYFWAHHEQTRGHLTMLAVLLFLLGLILIGLEIFVVPGLGVTGVSGVVLVLVSLALVTLVKRPETTREWMEFGATLTTLALGLGGAVVGAVVFAWYLPSIPYANRLVLAPPGEAAEGEEAGAPAGPPALLGVVGEAVTPLRPAGKARFGDDFVDVVAEGGYVTPGTRVQVIEVEGYRVVVKEV